MSSMPSQRIHSGLLNDIDTLSFKFNERKYPALQGDTLASALLANGQRLVGRSFKYHRPRGIFSAGSEEPNALVELGTGAHREPNSRATLIELHDGLEAASQNHRGPLSFDFMAVNDVLSSVLSAGFYYKTFMWPKTFWEKLYEPIIRAAAGLGSLSGEEDPDSYDKGFLHTDLLIIGAGPTGLCAALTAGRAGLRVIIADDDFLPGGRLNAEQLIVDGETSASWAASALAELKSLENVRVMTRTTVYGGFDHGIYGALERCNDHLPVAARQGKPRQVLWRIYTRQTLLATGSTERSIAFANNDRPGVMLAAAVRTYLNRFGVAPGTQIAVFTNNDDGWRTAQDFVASGIAVAAVIDPRDIKAPFKIDGADIFMGSTVAVSYTHLTLPTILLV